MHSLSHTRVSAHTHIGDDFHPQASAGGSEPSDAVRAVNALLTQLDGLKRFPNAMVLTTSNITVSDAAVKHHGCNTLKNCSLRNLNSGGSQCCLVFDVLSLSCTTECRLTRPTSTQLLSVPRWSVTKGMNCCMYDMKSLYDMPCQCKTGQRLCEVIKERGGSAAGAYIIGCLVGAAAAHSILYLPVTCVCTLCSKL